MTYKVITAVLAARTAIHIGNGESNDLTDAMVRRDAEGQPLIPGVAIAGALRALLTRLAPRLKGGLCAALSEKQEDRKISCDCAVCRLFGDINPSDAEGHASAASRLLVFNARQIDTPPCFLIRDGVGIDRTTGTAAKAGAVKFDLEVAPPGAAFEIRMELRNASQEDEQFLAAGLAEWVAGRLWLGGRVACGLGAFELRNLQFKILRLDTSEQLLGFLEDDEPWQQAQQIDGWLKKQLNSIYFLPAKDKPETVTHGWFSLTGALQAEELLLTNDTFIAGASGFDHAPLLAQWGDWEKPLLTGAGLRGVLRSHAERLARTLAIYNASGKDDFLQCCPACDPNVRRSEKDRHLPLECCDSLIKNQERQHPQQRQKTADNIDLLCLACRLFGSPRLGSRLIVEDALYKITPEQPKPVYKMLDFLAIDRFTGGGVDGKKFDALALWQPTFTLRLHLENPKPWELGWLWLTLRDLAEGWLTVGFGGSKGFGRVRLTDWTATFGYLLPEDALPGVAELGLEPQKSGLYKTTKISSSLNCWPNLAQRWVDAFYQQVELFKRPQELILSEDSYFGRPEQLETLYPVEKGVAQ